MLISTAQSYKFLPIRASSLFRNKVPILSSIEGYFVFSKDKGIAKGDSPNISSNFEWGILPVCMTLIIVSEFQCVMLEAILPDEKHNRLTGML